MKLSIVIPVFNVSAYLRRCLDSVLVDNKFSGEIVCVNDGSTDCSLDILNEYAVTYDNVRVISQANAGLSAARNAGFNSSTGDYVFFLDSDDWILPHRLDSVINEITDEDVVYFNATQYREDIKQLMSFNAVKRIVASDGNEFLKQHPKRDLPLVCVCGGVYSCKFLRENNLYNQCGIVHEDALFSPQVWLCAKKIKLINICLYVYRVRSGSINTTINRKSICDYLYVCRRLYEEFAKYRDVAIEFYNLITGFYVTAIIEAYDNDIAIDKFWHLKDSIVMIKYSENDYIRKLAVLSILSTKTSYKYSKNTLNPIFRKVINRVL